MQKCGPQPKPRCLFGLAIEDQAVGLVEDALVAVGRGEPEHELLALAHDRLSVQVDVTRRGAAHADDRGDHPHDLLDRRLRRDLHGLAGGRTHRVLVQQQHRAGHHVARRLVARDQQHQVVRVEVLALQTPRRRPPRLTSTLMRSSCGSARRLLGQLVEVVEDLGAGALDDARVGHVVRVGLPGHHVGPVQQAPCVLRVGAEHRGEDEDRDVDGGGLHEVTRTGGRAGRRGTR